MIDIILKKNVNFISYFVHVHSNIVIYDDEVHVI